MASSGTGAVILPVCGASTDASCRRGRGGGRSGSSTVIGAGGGGGSLHVGPRGLRTGVLGACPHQLVGGMGTRKCSPLAMRGPRMANVYAFESGRVAAVRGSNVVGSHDTSEGLHNMAWCVPSAPSGRFAMKCGALGSGTGGGGTRARAALAGRNLDGGGGGTVKRRAGTCRHREALMTSASSMTRSSSCADPSALGPRANTCTGAATRGDLEREASGRSGRSLFAMCTSLRAMSQAEELEAKVRLQGWRVRAVNSQ